MPKQLRSAICDAYGFIGHATPLRADCGLLCHAACCQGDERTGMMLFPGEAFMLSNVPGFQIRRIRYMDQPAWHLTCEGSCDRRYRPLACRIFPLSPHLDSDGRVRALPDVLARPVCPLWDGEHIQPRFRRAVNRSFQRLSLEPKMLDFMGRMSREREELSRFFVSSVV